jgi:hypothetical protein
MAGRFAYFMIGGVAVVGGMLLQGDLMFDTDRAEHEVTRAVERTVDRSVDRSVDRTVDRINDRETDRIVIPGEDRQAVATDAAAKRALSEAVAELVRAEASLITLKLDDELPAASLKQAEQRRDLARQAVDRLADDARAETRGNRDALRENIREEIREAVRS